MPQVRNLCLVLGDQCDAHSEVFVGCDTSQDAVWMAEVAAESTKVWSSKQRIAVFLSTMRHFRDALRAEGWRVFYRELTPKSGIWHAASGKSKPSNEETLESALEAILSATCPKRVLLVEPGEWSVRQAITAVLERLGIPWEMRPDTHFLCSHAEFTAHCQGRKQLRLEYFYREMRQRHQVLLEEGKPCGGDWNYDAENRASFGKEGPPLHRAPRSFPPDTVTQAALDLVNVRFAKHPGDLTHFDWPVTAADAELALADFVEHRLPEFGLWQDAMWTREPWLFHSRLSAAMNLKILPARRVIAAAESAYRSGKAPLAAVEGFIRQILGWREYVRGIYWRYMPDYAEGNALEAHTPLPDFYWNAQTDMACLRDTLRQTLDYGYAHHIQRLMVTGLYALLLGVEPRAVHEWYLAVYVDAVEWVELPNTLGMSQHADGGLMASKPYIASGKYLQRMSNYCAGCRYDPAQSTGPKACPFTTLYWDFLLRHEPRLARNPRMAMQVRNLKRLGPSERTAIADAAAKLRTAAT